MDSVLKAEHGVSTALLSYTLKCWTCLCFLSLDWTSWKPSRRLLWRSLPALRKILRSWGTWRRMQWCVVLLLCQLLECPFQINGVFFGHFLGLLERTVAQTEFFLQPAEAKVCTYQVDNSQVLWWLKLAWRWCGTSTWCSLTESLQPMRTLNWC